MDNKYKIFIVLLFALTLIAGTFAVESISKKRTITPEEEAKLIEKYPDLVKDDAIETLASSELAKEIHEEKKTKLFGLARKIEQEKTYIDNAIACLQQYVTTTTEEEEIIK